MQTSFKVWLCLGPMLAVSAGAVAGDPAAQNDLSGFKATDIEIVQLPKYCWSSFDGKWSKPGMAAFNLPSGCGDRFNHFCPGVLSLQRAKASLADGKKRAYWLGVAADHMTYTVGGLQKFPACPLRPTVDAMVQEIRTLRGQ